MSNSFLTQAIRYGIVGVINTLLTAVIIWVMMHLVFHVEKGEAVSLLIITVSNLTGFIVGLMNSFVWNKVWTFRSKNRWKGEFIRFIVAFLICYIPQLLLVNFLNSRLSGDNILFVIGNQPVEISYAYTCQLIGIVFYTSCNFLLNKFYTFKQIKK
jgi:putative flippase GtrA